LYVPFEGNFPPDPGEKMSVRFRQRCRYFLPFPRRTSRMPSLLSPFQKIGCAVSVALSVAVTLDKNQESLVPPYFQFLFFIFLGTNFLSGI